MKIIALSRWREENNLFWEIEVTSSMTSNPLIIVEYEVNTDAGPSVISSVLTIKSIIGKTAIGYAPIKKGETVIENFEATISGIKGVSISYEGEDASKQLNDKNYADKNNNKLDSPKMDQSIKTETYTWLDDEELPTAIEFTVFKGLITGGIIASFNDGSFPGVELAQEITQEAYDERLATPGEFQSDNFKIFKKKNNYVMYMNNGSSANFTVIQTGDVLNSVEHLKASDNSFQRIVKSPYPVEIEVNSFWSYDLTEFKVPQIQENLNFKYELEDIGPIGKHSKLSELDSIVLIQHN